MIIDVALAKQTNHAETSNFWHISDSPPLDIFGCCGWKFQRILATSPTGTRHFVEESLHTVPQYGIVYDPTNDHLQSLWDRGTWISAINSNTAHENTRPFETTNQPLGCPAGLYYCGTILTSSIVFIEESKPNPGKQKKYLKHRDIFSWFAHFHLWQTP